MGGEFQLQGCLFFELLRNSAAMTRIRAYARPRQRMREAEQQARAVHSPPTLTVETCAGRQRRVAGPITGYLGLPDVAFR